jgi:hypothetical protein
VPFAKGPAAKYRMRPICPACNQRPCAVNYARDGVTHYRSRCDSCARKNRGVKTRKPRWESAGFKKKMTCDRCGFNARYSSQILVYHVDGDLNNTGVKNLKCVCRNCVEAINKSDLPWKPGDLAVDL